MDGGGGGAWDAYGRKEATRGREGVHNIPR